ncbi:hypothetical protein QYM36_002070 [Artemia franciscana]|uniref:Endonuclease/exonuclease/phosphatase domain-containing protein n=1 Tax=Artemia franciscana TaxID=6661 RepID=A0AA88I933_ARTSF|nr:hypothetical protein QYM36_002070 [Artemia franciscana]
MGDSPSPKSDMARGQKGVSDRNQSELYLLQHLTKGGSGSNSPKQTGKVPEAAKGYVEKKLSILLKASGIKEGYGEVMNRSQPGGSIVVHVKNKLYAQKILEVKEIKFNEDLIVFEKGDKDTMSRNKISKRIGVMFMDKEVASNEETKQELLENEYVSDICLMGKPSEERNTSGVIFTYKGDQEFPTINYYNNRTENFSKSQFRKILKETEHPKIIIGDFNLHHTLWNDSHTEDGKAKELIDILIDPEKQIALATPKNLATRLNKTTGGTTTLDLTIISTELATDLAVYSKNDFDSDHFIIFTDIEFGPQPSACETREKWSFSDKRIAKWKEEISKLNLPSLKTLPTEETIKEVTEKIIEAGKKHLAIKVSQGMKKKAYNSTPGWTAKCEVIRRRDET